MVAGLFLVNADSGGAYPFNMIRTVVINTATAQPILLPQLFTDSTDGLNKLASLVKSSTAAPGGFAPFIDDPARDMANWVPSPEGLTVYAGVSHASGDYYPITVPWAQLKEVVAPAMWPVITS